MAAQQCNTTQQLMFIKVYLKLHGITNFLFYLLFHFNN